MRQMESSTHQPADAPVLWPEHFDVGIAFDNVNYGVSAGDDDIPEPYAYVGPWQPPPVGGFWTKPYGAARTVRELGGAAEILAFFDEGHSAAAVAAGAH